MPATPHRSGRKAREGNRFLSEVVADNIRSWRGLRRLSQTDLAERMVALGHPTWSQAAASSIERYNRAVTIDELGSLALILELSPADLLDPAGPDATELDVELTEQSTIAHRIASAWMRDRLTLRLDWDGNDPRPRSLVMIDRPGHEGESLKLVRKQGRGR